MGEGGRGGASRLSPRPPVSQIQRPQDGDHGNNEEKAAQPHPPQAHTSAHLSLSAMGILDLQYSRRNMTKPRVIQGSGHVRRSGRRIFTGDLKPKPCQQQLPEIARGGNKRHRGRRVRSHLMQTRQTIKGAVSTRCTVSSRPMAPNAKSRAPVSRGRLQVFGGWGCWGWVQGEVASAFGGRLRDGHSIGTPTVGGLGPGALKS